MSALGIDADGVSVGNAVAAVCFLGIVFLPDLVLYDSGYCSPSRLTSNAIQKCVRQPLLNGRAAVKELLRCARISEPAEQTSSSYPVQQGTRNRGTLAHVHSLQVRFLILPHLKTHA